MATKTRTVKTQDDHSMKRRLTDQLGVFKMAKDVKAKIAKGHANARQLTELAFYPEHDKRTESPAYKKVHERLVNKLDLPCLVCGVKKSTLKDRKQNPYGATALETHHHVIEWALANAIDPAKFNAILRPHLANQHPQEPSYKRNMSAQEVTDWVDHSEHNLWVLCDVHHRAKYLGIHEITYPIWCPQDFLKPDFEQYVRDEIGKLGKAGTKPKSAKKSNGKRKTR